MCQMHSSRLGIHVNCRTRLFLWITEQKNKRREEKQHTQEKQPSTVRTTARYNEKKAELSCFTLLSCDIKLVAHATNAQKERGQGALEKSQEQWALNGGVGERQVVKVLWLCPIEQVCLSNLWIAPEDKSFQCLCISLISHILYASNLVPIGFELQERVFIVPKDQKWVQGQ